MGSAPEKARRETNLRGNDNTHVRKEEKNMASLDVPHLTVTWTIPQPTATVKVTGKINFSTAETWLMDSAWVRNTVWFIFSIDIMGSPVGGTFTTRVANFIYKYMPTSGTTPYAVPYDYSAVLPISALNVNPAPGAIDKIYAKVRLVNIFTEIVKEKNSNEIDFNFGNP